MLIPAEKKPLLSSGVEEPVVSTEEKPLLSAGATEEPMQKSTGKKRSVLSENTVLKATEAKLESNLTKETKPAYEKIVVAGMKTGLEGGEASILAKLKDSKDPVSDAGKGAASLVFILRKESRDTMPVNAMVPAGATLMLYALDFIQKAGIAEIGKEEIATATKAYTDAVFKGLGITPQMLTKGGKTVKNLTKDPAIMEQMKRKAGMVKAPGTSSPTDLPVEDVEVPDAV